MKPDSTRSRILDPLERFSEIVFGLIMVLSFTCAISVAEAGRDDVRGMLIGAIGCNLAWGIIDAAFYLISCLVERGRNATVLRNVKRAVTPEEARQFISDALPSAIAEALPAIALDDIREHLKQTPETAEHARFTPESWRGAFGVFLLVFLSTLPVVFPFIFIHDARLALRISNAVAITMLFGAGHMLARYAGLRRIRTGLAMVAIGVVLVGLTIALGG
jgi:hypothetical protein